IPKRLQGHQYEDTSLSPSVSPPDPANTFQSGKHTAYTDALKWWKGTSFSDSFDATGDNLREAPYAQLYPRLCTRSNVFTVHYRVQLLHKSRSTQPDQWVEGKDQVVAEYRGQSTVERYLDPKDTKIPDYATATLASDAVDDFYKYRVTNRRQFSP
ncbi:MAG: Verru Chthon cassette protein, partial [Verrucomicrobiaceae bacterium]|nr:Verru Chthon cassette protein [Verrucomicrobiaceae bacterium]